MSTDDYKTIYGKDSLTCSEYRKLLAKRTKGVNNPNYNNRWNNDQKVKASADKKGIVPWNKGLTMTGEILKNVQDGIKKREERYKYGKLQRACPGPIDEKRRKILSDRQRNYAENNPTEMSTRAKKAIKTRIKNGYDTAFFRNMRHTTESLKKMKDARTAANLRKTAASMARITENAEKANCVVLEYGDVLQLQCTKCMHEFLFTKQYFTDSKLNVNCCPSCYPHEQSKRSAGETELHDFIVSLGVTAHSNYRGLIGKKEIDIYLPDHKIAIEYNGLYWHSEKVLESIGQPKTKDNQKRGELEALGIRYIAVFEDEWLYNREIVKSRLTNMLGKTPTIIHARKCELRSIDSRTAARFCEDNHIQGKGRSNARYGLYYKNELVSVMTFSKSNISRKISEWELNRFCSLLGTNIVGGASRLFSAFIKEQNPNTVITYADSRWSQGDLYKQLGFAFDHQTVPNYWYALPNELKRIHRFALRKGKNEDQTKTEKQLRDAQGYLRIWDCGSSKWIWTNKNGGN